MVAVVTTNNRWSRGRIWRCASCLRTAETGFCGVFRSNDRSVDSGAGFCLGDGCGGSDRFSHPNIGFDCRHFVFEAEAPPIARISTFALSS